MTTRNLVPRATNEGKIGISTKKWAEVNATNAVFTTLKVTNLKLDAEADLSLFTKGAGIEDISTNNNGQFVIAMDDTFLTSLGFNADGTKPNFAANGTVLAGDSFVTAINKLDQAVSNVADPANLDLDNFAAGVVDTDLSAVAGDNSTIASATAIKSYVDAQLTAQDLDFQGDAGGALSVDLDSQVFTIAGGTGLSSTGAGQTLTLSLDDTTVTAGSYGSASAVPTFTVDAQGRLTAAGTAAIETSFTISDNQGTPNTDVFANGGTLTFAGDTGITTTVSDDRITIDLDDTAVTPGSYGSATAIPTFTVDQQGRLTAAGSVGITTTLTVDSDNAGTQDVSLAEDDLQILGGTGLTSAVAKANNEVTVTLSLDNTAVAASQYGDADSVGQFTVDAQGRLTQAANVDISIASSQVNDATAANTAEKIVLRDANGNFVAGTITANLSGNATSADRWDSARTVTFAGGDVTGSFSIDGSADVADVSLTISANSVELGTDTTGNYVQSISAGAGIAALPAASESADLTVSVDGVLEDLNTLGAATADGEFIVATGAGAFAYESGDTARTSLGVGTGDSPEFSGLTLDNQGSLILKELNDNGDHSISIKSPASLAASYELVLPDNDGGANEVLVTDGDGNLSWNTVEGAAGNAVNAFSIISVVGQDNLEADAAQDTLNIAEGSAISITTTANTDTLTIAVSGLSNNQISETAAIVDTKLATISTANKVSIDALDLDGGTDISADLSDTDLIIVDDGAGGTNRKSAMSRVATFINDHASITTLSSLSSVGSQNNTLTAQGNLTVTGDLTVNGDQFVVDGTTVQLDDNLIELGLVGGNPPQNATTKDLGLVLHRHSGANASKLAFYWDESVDKFKLESEITETDGVIDAGGSTSTLVANLEGAVTGTVSSLANHDTTDLAEGANLYYTDARAQAAISVTDAGGDGSLSYAAGEITYTGPSAAETRAHFTAGTGVAIADGEVSIGQAVATNSDVTFNTVTANLTGNVTGTVSSLANHDTADLAEGAVNLYYTDARSRAAVSVTDSGGDGSLAYNNGTGVITYTGPSAAETRAHFTAGTGVAIDDGEVSIGQAVATNSNVTFNTVTANLTGNVTGTVSDVSNHDTDDITEGLVNLYHTNARARSSISITDAGGDGSLAYNDGTGVITYTGPSAAEVRAHVSGGTGVTITDGAIAIGQAVDTNSNVTFNQVTAALVGNASTATTLANSRGFEIGAGPVRAQAVAFDGSGNVSLTSSIADSQITNAMLAGSIDDSKLNKITSSNKIDLSAIDIDGGTAIDELVSADLFIVDDAGTGVNRKATLAQLISLLESAGTIDTLPSLATVGTIGTGTWQGTAIADAYVSDALTINGGSVNSSPIGATTASTGTFTVLTANTSLALASGATVTAILDEDNLVSNSDTALATQQSIKSYVDTQISGHCLFVSGDNYDENDASTLINVSLANEEKLEFAGGAGITTSAAETAHTVGNDIVTIAIDNSVVATLTDEQTLTNKTLTSPTISGLSLSDSSIVFEGSANDEHELTLSVENPTSDVTVTIPAATDTLVGRDTTDTLTNKSIDADSNTISNLEVDNLKAGVLDTDLSAVAETDTTLPSAKAVKSYVDEQLGRFGGMFLTSYNSSSTEYDVVFDSSPLIRSHFGPFAFDLGQLHSEGGSDILFYGARATGASDRHFLVVGSGDDAGDTKFTGADENTP